MNSPSNDCSFAVMQVAAAIPGTIVSEVCGTCVKDRSLRLGHTAGCMHVFASVKKSQEAHGNGAHVDEFSWKRKVLTQGSVE